MTNDAGTFVTTDSNIRGTLSVSATGERLFGRFVEDDAACVFEYDLQCYCAGSDVHREARFVVPLRALR